MTEAELQVVLITLIEHYFQDAFKNCRIAGNSAYMLKETTLMVIMASMPKVGF
jgi:hypothetical protein